MPRTFFAIALFLTWLGGAQPVFARDDAAISQSVAERASGDHKADVLAFCLIGCGPSELSGIYEKSWGRQIYRATFRAGRTIEIISPSNGQSFSGTYKIEGGTVLADFGFAKLNYQIVDSQTLDTNWAGTPVRLKKQ